MAFPADYTLFQEVTIDNTKVDADLTDFPIFIDLSNLSKAGADIFDTVRTDGGDIRVTKDDGTTQLAREVVSIDTSGKTGELHVKFTGTLSSSVDTVIQIHYNGVDTEPARTATFGSDNVWTDYSLVVHGEVAGEDSSANDFADTANGNLPTTITGKVGGGQDYDGTGDFYNFGNQSEFDVSGSVDRTMQTWFRTDVTPANHAIGSKWKTSATQARSWLWRHETGGTLRFFTGNGGSTTGENVQSTTTVAINTFGMCHITWDGSATTGKIYVNGGDEQTNTGMTTNSASAALYGIGAESGNGTTGSAVSYAGILDETRIRPSVLASTWISTEFSNQNVPSTFYSTSDEMSSGVAFIPRIIMS